MQNALRSPATEVTQLIESVDTLPGSRSVLRTGGQWYATSISVGQSAIPPAERALVLSGTPASQRFTLAGTPQQVIGVPLPAVHAAYFEVFSLDELAGTLRALAFALAGAALVTTIAGAAVGRWASSRALRPLAGLTDAAVAIAGGQLDTRVETGDDADLEELASAFNRMTANLQDRIEREARFTSDVSHELRSPLTTLTATVSVLEGHRAELAPRAQRALDLLDGDLRRFTRMVDDLLEISRFDAGSAELSLDEVDPGELVRRAVAAAAPVGADGVRGSGHLPGRGRPGRRRAPAAGRQAPLRAGDGQPGGERRPLRRRGHPGAGRAPARPDRTGVLPPADAIRVVVEDHGPGRPRGRARPPVRALLPGRSGRPAGLGPGHRARAVAGGRARPPARRPGVERGRPGRGHPVRGRAAARTPTGAGARRHPPPGSVR